MKAALYVVFSVIVTTLALQSPNEHVVQQRILDQIVKVGTALAEVMPEDRRFDSRRQFHTGVNYRKKNRQLDVDHVLSAAELALRAAELYGNRRYGQVIALNRRQGAAGKKDKPAAKGGEKSDKGGGKPPAKESPPAENPVAKEMPSAGGNPSWEDIFKQIVIKVISRRSGHTRRTFGEVPYDVLDLQQRSLHDLLHMLYYLPYYGEPVYGYRNNWNPESGMNGRVRIHSVKYSNPPQTADMDIRF